MLVFVVVVVVLQASLCELTRSKTFTIFQNLSREILNAERPNMARQLFGLKQIEQSHPQRRFFSSDGIVLVFILFFFFFISGKFLLKRNK